MYYFNISLCRKDLYLAVGVAFTVCLSYHQTNYFYQFILSGLVHSGVVKYSYPKKFRYLRVLLREDWSVRSTGRLVWCPLSCSREMAPCGGVLGKSHWTETSVKTQDTLERIRLLGSGYDKADYVKNIFHDQNYGSYGQLVLEQGRKVDQAC